MVCVFKDGDGGEVVNAEHVRGVVEEKRKKGKMAKTRRGEGTKGRNIIFGFWFEQCS